MDSGTLESHPLDVATSSSASSLLACFWPLYSTQLINLTPPWTWKLSGGSPAVMRCCSLVSDVSASIAAAL